MPRGRNPLAAIAVALVWATTTACVSPYREWVTRPADSGSAIEGMAYVGVRDVRAGGLAVEASRRLERASALPLASVALAEADWALLLSDPGLFAIAAEDRASLRERLGRRLVLVGAITTVPVDRIGQWAVLIPYPLPLSVLPVMLLFPVVPIPYAHEADVLHAAWLVRLVDLESGRVEAEYAAIASRGSDRERFVRERVSAAVRTLALGGRP